MTPRRGSGPMGGEGTGGVCVCATFLVRPSVLYCNELNQAEKSTWASTTDSEAAID